MFRSKSLFKQLFLFCTILIVASRFDRIACAQNTNAQEDRIFTTKGGAAIKGQIVERTRDKVVIAVKGTNQNFATNEIARIVNKDEPQQLTRAKDLLSQGSLDQAIQEFKKINSKDIAANEIKQDYEFYRGYLAASNALQGKGDASAAKTILLGWAKDNATSSSFYLASEKLGELSMSLGAADQAAKYFGVLAGSPFPDMKVKGGYLAGKALLTLKLLPEAKAKFETVTQAQVSDPSSLKMKKLASVGIIGCDAADGKSEQAIAALEKLVEEGDSSDAELFAEIYNTMGGILASMDRNPEAILSYLKTRYLYASQTESHAEALYQLSVLFPKVSDSQRGADAKTELSKLYPTSPWLKK
jgi:tetratricopeptide (TPR) repeat protein